MLDLLPNYFIERKTGVLVCHQEFPKDELEEHVSCLKEYQSQLNRPLVRICYNDPLQQDMLMLASQSCYTLPHYQEAKTIKYQCISGILTLYWFTTDNKPHMKCRLQKDDHIVLQSHFPRTMLFESHTCVFREQLTGDFSDEMTIWPTGLAKKFTDKTAVVSQTSLFTDIPANQTLIN